MVNQISGTRSFRERSGWGFSEVAFFCVLAFALAAVLYCGRFAYREGSLLEGAKGNAQAIARWAEAAAAANARGEPFGPQACSSLLLPLPAPTEAAAGVLPDGPPVAPVTDAEAVSSAAGAGGMQRIPVVAVSTDPARPPADAETAETAQAADPARAGAVAERAAPTWQACREALFGPGGPFAELSNPFNAQNTLLGTRCERKSAATRGHVLIDKGTVPPPGVTGSTSWGPLEDKDMIAKGLMLRIQVCDAGGYAIKVAEVTL